MKLNNTILNNKNDQRLLKYPGRFYYLLCNCFSDFASMDCLASDHGDNHLEFLFGLYRMKSTTWDNETFTCFDVIICSFYI